MNGIALTFRAGGVDVPFHVGADAHSDGDAMYHRYFYTAYNIEHTVALDAKLLASCTIDAVYFIPDFSIVDSILGALSLPDIGQLFPDNDPNWRGADSSIFMEEVLRVLSTKLNWLSF